MTTCVQGSSMQGREPLQLEQLRRPWPRVLPLLAAISESAGAASALPGARPACS